MHRRDWHRYRVITVVVAAGIVLNLMIASDQAVTAGAENVDADFVYAQYLMRF